MDPPHFQFIAVPFQSTNNCHLILSPFENIWVLSIIHELYYVNLNVLASIKKRQSVLKKAEANIVCLVC